MKTKLSVNDRVTISKLSDNEFNVKILVAGTLGGQKEVVFNVDKKWIEKWEKKNKKETNNVNA